MDAVARHYDGKQEGADRRARFDWRRWRVRFPTRASPWEIIRAGTRSTRLEAADNTPANTANKRIIKTGGIALHSDRISMVAAATLKLPMRKVRRDNLSTTLNPATAPAKSDAL